MNVGNISSIVSLALQVLDYFINLDDNKFKAVNVPSELKSKIALERAKKEAREKYGG